MTLEALQGRIQDKTAKLGVIGLGYVGLPVACVFADAGFDVVGVDVKADRVATLNAGTSPIEGDEPGLAELLAGVVASGRFRAATDYAALAGCDVITINVETPVDEDHQPRYEALRSVLRRLGPVLKAGALVIVESTLAPGTMDQTVRPLLEAYAVTKVNEGFYLGHCPERVMPGKLLANLRGMSRVCGGATPATAEAMIALYRHVVDADLDPADCVTAELVKTAENAYRDVNIAFANEVALICEAVGGDVWSVRELVNKSPGRNMLLPGAGVGGHCIPKDPWLLIANAGDGVEPRLIPAARAVNDGMPMQVLRMLRTALKKAGRELSDATILVLGYAYLENSDDARNSPSADLVQELEKSDARIIVQDPYISRYQGDVVQMARDCDAVILMVKHEPYETLNLRDLQASLRTPIIIDGRNMYESENAKRSGFVYRRVGKAAS